MDRHQITETYSVSPQIFPEDLATLAADGIKLVINNRPDGEVPPELQSAAMQAAAEEAGLVFVDNPVVHGALTLDIVEAQRAAITGSDGPVHAYCASGNRSTVVWGMAFAGDLDAAEIVERAAAGGYDLSGLRPQLEALAAQRKG